MKNLLLLSVIILSGCTAFQQKTENYDRAASMALNPEKITIIYERDGGNASFRETRCTGRLCEQ